MKVVRRNVGPIEAMQLTETNAKEVLTWILTIKPTEVIAIGEKFALQGNTIANGEFIAFPGDYIVYEAGEFDVYWEDDFNDYFKEVE